MSKIKIKRFIYMLLSGSVFFSMLFYAIYVANVSTTPLSIWDHIGFTTLSIIIFLAANAILGLITMIMMGEGEINVLFPVGFLFYTFLGKYKYVYHSELGYFITSVTPTCITVYRQGMFNMKEIFSVAINDRMDIESIQNSIKNGLDSHYHEKLMKAEVANKG